MGNSIKRFLSLALALVMVFTMLPGTVFAASTGVTTEAALIEALAEGGEVSLGGDIEAAAAITITGEVELNLGGHTLTVPYIVNEGTFAVSNGSIVDTTFDSENNGAIINKGTLTTENVNITGAACVIRSESGTVTINGGTYKLNGVNATSCNLFRMKGDSELTVNSGSFIGARSNTTVSAESSTIISGDNGTAVVINGGEFSYFDIAAMFSGSSEVTIKGGTYNKYGGDYSITVWFDGSNSKGYKVAEGYIYNVSEDGKVLTVVKGVAKIGNAYYATLADAISAANDGDEIVIMEALDNPKATVNRDVTINLNDNTLTDAYIVVTADVTIKNGDIKNTEEAYPFVVQNGGELTIENVDIEASKSDRAIWVRDNSTLNFNSGSILVTKGENNTKTSNIVAIYTSTNTQVNINGGTITVDTPNNKANGIYGNYNNADVKMTDGKISTSGGNYSYGIHVSGDITISGGEIVTNEKGYGYSSGISYGYNYALNTELGNITITGGTITTNGHSGYLANVGRSYQSNDQTVEISNVNFANNLSEVDMTTGGHKAPPLINENSASNVTATITSGTFEGISETVIKGDSSNLTISGGTYSVDVTYYLADGLQVKDNGDGTFGIEEAPKGTVTIGYTSVNDIWGEASTNAKESLVVEIYEGENKASTTTLNNIGGIIDGDVTVTWHNNFVGNFDEYWTTTWEAGYPNAGMKLDKVVLYVDGVKVHENVVKPNGPDDFNKIVASAEKNGEFLGYYTSFQTAVEEVEDGATIILVQDVTFTSGANGTTNGISYTRDASFTLDLNGKTVTSNLGNNALRFKIGDGTEVSKPVTITIKNGKVVSGANNWCAISAASTGEDHKLTMNLEDLVIEANKGGDYAVKSWEYAVVNAENVTVNANYAGGFYAAGGEIVLDNCDVEQIGLHTAPYNSMAVGVSSGGKLTVNSGTYSTEPKAASDAYNQGSSHGSWVGGVMNSGGTLIINDGTFANGNYGEDSLATAARGLLMVDAGAALEITGGEFVALKGVIDYTNNLGDASKNPVVTISGGTYTANPEAKFVAKGKAISVNADNTEWKVVDAVAQIGDAYYASLQDALDAIGTTAGNYTILLTGEIDEVTDFKQAKDVNITIDGQNKTTYTGTIQFHGNAQVDGKLTIKNIEFTTDNISHDFIKSVNTNYYPSDLVVQGCSFTGTGDTSADGYAVVAVRLKSAKNVLIKDCTGSGLHSFLQNTAGWDITIEDITVTDSLGGLAMGTVQTTKIKNVNLDVRDMGIRLDAVLDTNATIEASDVKAFIPVVVRKASANEYNVVFTGTNNFTETNTDGYWCVIGTGEYNTNGVMPDAATGKVYVALNGAGLDEAGVYGAYTATEKEHLIVSVGEGKDYATIKEAVEAANAQEYASVTLNIYGVQEMDYAAMFNTTTIVSIVGMTEDAEIILKNRPDHTKDTYANPNTEAGAPAGFSFPEGNSYVAGSEFYVSDIKITNLKDLQYKLGHDIRTAYYMYCVAEYASYTNVDFVGGVVLEKNGSFVGCTFTEDNVGGASAGMYCLFIDQEYSKADASADVIIDDCEFRPASTAYGAVKIANDKGDTTIVVTDSIFEAVPNKPAIDADSNITANITGNTFIDCVNGSYKADQPGTVNGVTVTGEDMTEAISDANTVDIFGDINGDLERTTADAVILARYLVNMVELTEEQLYHADVNRNGEIRNSDLVILVRRIVEADK